MMKTLMGLTVLLASLMAVTASADDLTSLYVGAGPSNGSVSRTHGDDKSLGTVNLSVGMELVDFIGVELQFGAAFDQSDSILGEPLVQYQAAMLRPGWRKGGVGVYLLGGQARLDIDSRFNNSEAGIAMGAGINLFGNRNTALNFHVLDFDDGAFRTAS